MSVEAEAADSTIPTAIKYAADNGLTLAVSRTAGRGAKLDGLHFRWSVGSVHVADWWPSTGKLTIGGSVHWPEDAVDATRIVIAAVKR